MFADREDAGRRLAEALKASAIGDDAVIAALPRGGVVLGRIVADALRLPLDVIVPRKIGAPGDPEYAVGAVAEGGEPIWNEAETASIDPAYLEERVVAERTEAERRLKTYRAGLPARKLRGKTVVIVDDGIATGLTMRAAIITAKKEGALRLIAAVPVAARDTADAIRREVDGLVVLSTPLLFGAIGASYREFPQVDDAAVTRLMRRT